MKTLLDDAEHWLSRAEETRTIAEIMTDPEARRIMFDIAEGYDRLAERAVERTEQNRQPAMRSAFVGVRIPAIEGECANARTIRSSHEARRAGRSFGEIGKQRSPRLRPGADFVHAPTGDRCQSVTFFQCAGKHRISMAVEVEQAT